MKKKSDKANPYQDAKDLSPMKWMINNHKKQMIFSFLFFSIFVAFPWIPPYKIDATWLALLISSIGLTLNFVGTILHPYLNYRSSLREHERWQNNFEKGLYDEK